MVSKALTYLDILAQEANGDLSLQRELATAYERVGEVQGSSDNSNLGNTAGALASLKKAAAIREAIAAGEHNSPESLSNVANVYEMLGIMLSESGQYQGALEYAQKTLAIRQQLSAARQTPEGEEGLAGAYYVLGLSQSALGDLQGALSSLQKSAAAREAITNPPPSLYAEVRTRLSGTYGEMSLVLEEMDEPAEAIVAARRGLEVMNALAAAHPDNRLYREYAMNIRTKSATISRIWETTSKRRAITKGPSPASGRHLRLIPTTRIRRSGWVSAKAALERSKSRTAKSLPVWKTRTGLQLALELYRADPAENNDKLTDLADAYAAYGFAYAHLAQRPTISIPKGPPTGSSSRPISAESEYVAGRPTTARSGATRCSQTRAGIQGTSQVQRRPREAEVHPVEPSSDSISESLFLATAASSICGKTRTPISFSESKPRTNTARCNNSWPKPAHNSDQPGWLDLVRHRARQVGQSETRSGSRTGRPVPIDVDKSSSHHLSQIETSRSNQARISCRRKECLQRFCFVGEGIHSGSNHFSMSAQSSRIMFILSRPFSWISSGRANLSKASTDFPIYSSGHPVTRNHPKRPRSQDSPTPYCRSLSSWPHSKQLRK